MELIGLKGEAALRCESPVATDKQQKQTDLAKVNIVSCIYNHFEFSMLTKPH